MRPCRHEPYFDEDYWGETCRSAVTEQQVNYYYEQVLPDGSIEPETFLYSVRKRTAVSDGSNQSLSFESGSTVHYDEVAEYEMDGGRMSGKTVYKYDGGSMPTIHSTPLYPYPEPEQWYLAPLTPVIRLRVSGRTIRVGTARNTFITSISIRLLDSSLLVWSPLEAEFQTNVTGRDFRAVEVR